MKHDKNFLYCDKLAPFLFREQCDIIDSDLFCIAPGTIFLNAEKYLQWSDVALLAHVKSSSGLLALLFFFFFPFWLLEYR